MRTKTVVTFRGEGKFLHQDEAGLYVIHEGRKLYVWSHRKGIKVAKDEPLGATNLRA